MTPRRVPSEESKLLEKMFRPHRVGVCRIYFLDEDVTCPLCGTYVPARQLHECAVNEQPPSQ